MSNGKDPFIRDSKGRAIPNLSTKYITLRVKDGEKAEIYKYAKENGFDNISTFIKTLVWEKIRGNQVKKEEIQEQIIKELKADLEEGKQQRKEIMELVKLSSVWKKLEEEDK